jgi:hypothetical protein
VGCVRWGGGHGGGRISEEGGGDGVDRLLSSKYSG